MRTADQWISELADLLDVTAPTAEETEQLLALAGVAAHASERPAAPLSCWLVAKSGLSPADALQQVKGLAAAD